MVAYAARRNGSDRNGGLRIAGQAGGAASELVAGTRRAFAPSIPDYLALVGDAADGYPGLPGWGPKSSAAVLAKFLHPSQRNGASGM
jgi:hypothetical protein